MYPSALPRTADIHQPTPHPLAVYRKELYMSMENFAQLLEESFTLQEMNPGEVITAEVVAIDQNFVTVNAGLKSESLIDVAEFKNAQGEIEVKVGDFVTVTIESVENGFGETKLSREKAKRAADWIALEEAMENGDILSGIINGKVKGGLTVMISSIRAFLPGSLVDVRPVKDTSHFEAQRDRIQSDQTGQKTQQRRCFPPRRSKPLWVKNAKPCWKTCKKAPSSKASLKTLPITVHSLTWAASTVCCTSPIWHGGA